jgi:predicted DNA-binding ribbon-helix-helix protein
LNEDLRPASAGVKKRSLVIAGHKTSVSLEAAFWDALKDIAKSEGVSLAALVVRIDASRETANLSSALRVFVLEKATSRSYSPERGSERKAL